LTIEKTEKVLKKVLKCSSVRVFKNWLFRMSFNGVQPFCRLEKIQHLDSRCFEDKKELLFEPTIGGEFNSLTKNSAESFDFLTATVSFAAVFFAPKKMAKYPLY